MRVKVTAEAPRPGYPRLSVSPREHERMHAVRIDGPNLLTRCVYVYREVRRPIYLLVARVAAASVRALPVYKGYVYP